MEDRLRLISFPISVSQALNGERKMQDVLFSSNSQGSQSDSVRQLSVKEMQM